MASFNESIRQFNTRYYRLILKLNLWWKWSYYQNKRFKESYFPAFIKYKIERKSIWNIVTELIELTFKFKCLPYHYFRYGLYRKRFDFETVKKFFPETLFYYKILPKINTHYVLLDDKNIFESIMKGSGLKYPETILKKKNGTIYDNKNERITTEVQLRELLDKTDESVIFCKPASYSSGGKGIFLIRKTKDGWTTNDQKVFDLHLLKDEMESDWILQKPVKNCEKIARIHNRSTNSFRVLTVFKADSEPRVIYISLKLGTDDNYTDNAHTGGLYVGVDHQTGQLHKKGFDEKLNEYDRHPLSKKIFENIKIDRIKEVTDYAIKAAAIFSDLTVVGWDIVLSDEGPYILEGNSSSGLTIFQRPFNGLDA